MKDSSSVAFEAVDTLEIAVPFEQYLRSETRNVSTGQSFATMFEAINDSFTKMIVAAD
jgi:hypothetical protein